MSEKSNILFITSDQQHWFSLGCMNPEIKTPNLDRLVREGTNFTRAYTVNPTCTPTRASCITGTYPSQHGAYSLGTKLMEDVHTVGEDFTSAGYRTALIGKAHFQPLNSTDEYSSLEASPTLQDLDFWRQFIEPFYGFEHVELARNHADSDEVGQHYALWLEEKGCLNWRDYFEEPTGKAIKGEQKHSWALPEKYHYGTWVAERSNAMLETYARNDENFYLWASFADPHPKYLAPKPWDTMYAPATLTVPTVKAGEHEKNPPHFQMTQTANPDFSGFDEPEGAYCHGFHTHLHSTEEMARNIATYYGMISLMDKQIGTILDKLDALGLTDRTLVVFTTDHGHVYGHHGLASKGAFHYEDMIKIPMIARFPGKIPAGKTSSSLQSIVDMAPTFLSAAGIPVPRCMTGLNMMPEWTEQCGPIRDHIICENRHQPTTLYAKTFVNERYKLTVYRSREYGELFDLETDPGEHNNLWNEPATKDLKCKLITKLLHAEMGKEPIPMPRIACA